MVTIFAFLELYVPEKSQNCAMAQFPQRTNDAFKIGAQ